MDKFAVPSPQLGVAQVILQAFGDPDSLAWQRLEKSLKTSWSEIDPRMADLKKKSKSELVDDVARLRLQVLILQALLDAQASEAR